MTAISRIIIGGIESKMKVFREFWSQYSKKNFKFGWSQSPVTSLPSRNQKEKQSTAIKELAKVHIKSFLSFPILLDFFTLFQIFCLELQFWKSLKFNR